MSLTYTIDPGSRLVRLRYEGDPSFEEWAAIITEVFAHPEFQLPMSILVDRRGAAVPRRDYIRRTVEFARENRTTFAGTRWALVTDTADGYARASMAQMLNAKEFEVRVFTDIKEAEDWLGRGPARKCVLTYSIDPTTRLVRLHYDGTPTFEEWETVLTSALADETYRPGFSFLADRRGADPPTTDYIRCVIEFGWQNKQELAGGRWAVVVDGPAATGMARMGEVLGENFGIEMGIFTDLAEAVAWLLKTPVVEGRG